MAKSTRPSQAAGARWASHDGHRNGHSCDIVKVIEQSADRSFDLATDLQRRINRTLAYIEELQPEALSSDARLTLDAVRRSLTTPVVKETSDG